MQLYLGFCIPTQLIQIHLSTIKTKLHFILIKANFKWNDIVMMARRPENHLSIFILWLALFVHLLSQSEKEAFSTSNMIVMKDKMNSR